MVSGGSTICEGDSVQLNSSSTIGTFFWTPGSTLSDSSIYNPFASPVITTDYILHLTDSLNCIIEDTVKVNVDPQMSLNVSNDTSICLGDCANLIATGALSYSWETSASLSDTSISNPIACPNSTELFTVYGSSGLCSDTAQVTVTVNPLPTVNAGTDIDICFGDTVQLNASGVTNYTWSPPDSLSSINIPDPLAWPADSTQYIVTGTDINNCSNTDTILVNVNPLPNVNAGTDTSLCAGDTIQLNAQGASSYIWSPATFLSNNTIADPLCFPTTTITYTVTGTDNNSCISSDSITVTINNLPIGSVSNDTTICFGDTAQLIASGGTNYTWSPSDSLSSTVISNPLAWPSSTTIYQVIISDNNFCNDTAQVTVTINPLPTVNAGTDIDICFGDTAQLNASGAINYTWSPSDSLSSIIIPDPLAWPADSTQYIVTGLDALGCNNSDTMMVNVNPLPLADAGADLWICPGDSIQLNASGGIIYSWSPLTNISDPNIADPMVSLTDTTDYIVIVTSNQGCIDSDTVTIFVNPNVPTNAGSDTSICVGDTIQLGGNPTAVNGTVYLWSPAGFVDDPNISNPMAFPDVPTTFFVVTSNDTCSGIDSVFVDVNPFPPVDAGADIQICIGDTTQLNVTGAGISFIWTPVVSVFGDTILSNDTIADPLAFPDDTTTYVVNATDIFGCTVADSVTVIVNPLPNANAGNDIGLCIGDSIQLNASGGDTYLWSPNDSISNINIPDPIVFPIDTSTYTVTVTDSNSCVNSDSIIVTVHPLPNVSAGADDTICMGDTIQLIGTGALNYAWTPNDSISNDSVPYPFVWPSVNIDYVVVGTDANGCVSSDTVNISVNSLPVINAGSDVQICIGDSVQLNASGGDSYQWSPAGSLTNSIIADPVAFPTDTTDYIVTSADTNGCVSSDTVRVIVNPLPDANAGFNVNICEGGHAFLNASGGILYQWSPSAYLNHDTVADPLAFPDTSMVFTVDVTDSNGCTASDSMIVIVFMVYAVDDQYICEGDSVQLDVFGEPGVSFSWSPVTGLSDPNIINPWASPTSTTTYVVTATDSQGCTDQADVVVEVSDDQATFDTEIVGGCDGAVVTFNNTSDPANDFIWYFSNGDSSIQITSEHIFPFGTDFSAMLIITNQHGCIDTALFNGSTLNFDDYFILLPVDMNIISPHRL